MSIKLAVPEKTMMQLKPRISVIGVGGGGGNAVNNIIPLYRGCPVANDTLFFLHTIPNIPGALQVDTNLNLTGEFNAIK